MNKQLLVLAVATLFFRPAFAQTIPALPPAIPAPAPSAGALPAEMTLGAQFGGGIRIQDFARVVLTDVLKSQFVFSSDFLASAAQVGFSAKDLKRNGSEALLRDVLQEHGFSLDKRAGYYRVSRTKEEDKPDQRRDFLYRLKNRDLGYISAQIQPLFSSGSFTYQRAIATPQSATQTQQGAQSNSAKPLDTGGSLYSMTTRTDSDILLFHGLPSDIERLKTVLAQLDVPVPRVLVRAFVLETGSNEQTGYSVSAVAKLLSSRLNVTVSGTTLPNALTFKTGDVQAVASALAGDSSVRVLTAPSVYAESGASASMSVGNSVPTLGSIQYNNNGQSQQSVSYQDTGVILRMTPRVLDDAISVQLHQEISDAIQTETGVSGSPTITKRSLDTTLNMRSGEWVILGGLTSSKSSMNTDSLPFLRSLMLGKMSSNAKSDIVVLLYVERS